MDGSRGRSPGRAYHALAVGTAVTTLGLILVGAIVKNKGASLAVPDWPLSYGMLMPPMVGNIFWEHGHRMIAATVGFLTLVLCVWAQAREPRRWVRWLAIGALFAVCLQGSLGGLTVMFLLPKPISIGHGMLAQVFFCLAISLALVTSPAWRRVQPARLDAAGRRGLRRLVALAWAAVFVQLFLGALVRHLDAGLAIADFPTMHGGLLPRFEEPGVIVHFLHRLFALVVLGAVVASAVRTLRAVGHERVAAGAARSLLLLVPFQIALGATAVLTHRALTPTTLHVATGALILGTQAALSVWVYRATVEPARASAPVAPPVPAAAPVALEEVPA